MDTIRRLREKSGAPDGADSSEQEIHDLKVQPVRRMTKPLFYLLVALFTHGTAAAQDLARGQIIDDVQCADDTAQHYSLYLPSNFTPDRTWPIILAFDAGGRGRRAVERYQVGAERYGYIVAGSNNSRNGPWKRSLNAAKAMTADLTGRFPVDPKRIYTAGMSGGARVAMMVALHPEVISGRVRHQIAGVFASSAGFPPGEFRASVGFPIFGTAGTEDFNHREMTHLDRALKSPHRVVVFEGGHTWLPSELATEAIEWMELQGMSSGIRSRDQTLVDDMFARRMARAEGLKSSLARMRELQSIADDFQRFRNVTGLHQRVAALNTQPDVKEALDAERADEVREDEMTAELVALLEEVDITSGFAKLKERVIQLLGQSRAAEDSSSRRIARRVLTSLRASTVGVRNPELQTLLDQIPVLGPR
jgi:poly(3-hydroxybutyrate) depolymerase